MNDMEEEPTSLEIELTGVGLSGECPRGWWEEGERFLLPNPWGLKADLRFLEGVEGCVMDRDLERFANLCFHYPSFLALAILTKKPPAFLNPPDIDTLVS
jgi:hypothetical protein